MAFDWDAPAYENTTAMYRPPNNPPNQYYPGVLSPQDAVAPQMWTTEQFIKGWNFQQSAYVQALLDAHGYLSGEYHQGQWYDKTITALNDAMDASRSERMEFSKFLMTGAPPKLASGSLSSSSGGGTGPDMSPKTYTETSTNTTDTTSNQVNLSSRAGARQVLVGALATELGREPTAHEVSVFLRNLNRRERRNPTVSHTTGTTTTTSSRTVDPSKSGSSTTSSSKTTGETTTTTKQSNVDPAAMAERFAKQENPEEWRMFQNAQYYDVLAQMLGM